ncbi:MAG: phosphate ABC transporter substrate-binding protein [Opitutales bacterium]|nr:phosphate ABC transporter substrate-binding protein [Opitutales bacterium]
MNTKKILQVFAVSLTALISAQSYAENNSISVDGSTTVGPIAKAFAEYYRENNPSVNITISESGSGNGVKSLMNGSCNIATMSRFMKAGEFKSCVEKSVLPVAHTVAYDGLAVIVNPQNKISALSEKQIADIYTGKITNWKELGGEDAKIVVISRDSNSGTYETFNELVLKKAKIAKSAEYVGSNGQARSRVNSTKNAIAYVGLGFADSSVKALSVDGILPTPQTVATGKYPIARPLYMFTNGSPKMGSHLFNFVTLCLTPEGREIVTDLGFVAVCK